MNTTSSLAAVVAKALDDAGLTGPNADRQFTIAELEAVAILTGTTVSDLVSRIEQDA